MVIPYIGITDFTSFEQVESMLDVFRSHRTRGSKHQLHVGVMMSFKTLNDIETKWAKAFPQKESIAGIFDSDETFNCLHYADYDHTAGFWKDLARAIECGGIGIHAVQLDMVWPDPGDVEQAVHASRKQLEVILQIGRRAIEDAFNDPGEVVQRLKDYEEVIHRVLLDKSMGRGIGMDAAGLIPFAQDIRKHFPTIGIGVAGGLGPYTMELLTPLLFEFPDISIDAQGQLRPSGNALDPVDWRMARDYLISALTLFT